MEGGHKPERAFVGVPLEKERLPPQFWKYQRRYLIVQIIDPSCQVVNMNTYTTAQGNKLRTKSDSVISYEL